MNATHHKSRVDSKGSSKSQRDSTLSKAQSDYITVHQTVQTVIQKRAKEKEDLKGLCDNLILEKQQQALQDLDEFSSDAYRVDNDTFAEYKRTLQELIQKAKEVTEPCRKRMKARKAEVGQQLRELESHLTKWENEAETAKDEALEQLVTRMNAEYAKYTGSRPGN